MTCAKCVKSARSIKLSKAATIKAKRMAAAGKVQKANPKKANAKKANPKKAKPCKC